MRTRFEQAPGVSFRAIGLQTGLAYGVEIDNRSGSWLYIPSLETYVQPYTVGWSTSFPYGVAALDIIAGQNGPAGQISTTQGESVIVYLTDEKGIGGSLGTPHLAASPDPGAPFITQFTPNLLAPRSHAVTLGSTDLATLVAGVPGKRIRILTIDAILAMFPAAGGNFMFHSGINFVLQSDGLPQVTLMGRITRDVPVYYRSGLNVDLPIDQGLEYEASTDFADSYISLRVVYQVI